MSSEWRHLEDTQPKARKEHQCILCERPIRIGETYVRRVGFGERGRETCPMHMACEAETYDWMLDDWQCNDPAQFREMMEAIEQRAGAVPAQAERAGQTP